MAKVYVKTDSNSVITEINSDIFLSCYPQDRL